MTESEIQAGAALPFTVVRYISLRSGKSSIFDVASVFASFGGADRGWLYVTTAAGRVYRRPVKRTGAVSWEPVKPPMPGL